MTLFGKGVLIDVITFCKDLEMSGLSRWALNPMTSVFIRGRREDTNNRRRPCEDEAESGVMQPQAKERLEPPKAERGQEGVSEPWRAQPHLSPGFQASGLQNCERNNHYCFKSLSMICYDSPRRLIH